MRILITDQNFGDDARVERELAADAGVDLRFAECTGEADVAAAVADCAPDALVVQFVPVGRVALAGATSVRGIVRCGIGVDTIDLAAAAEAGIPVARVPDYCIDEVADHTLALVLAVERAIPALAADDGWNFRAGGALRRLRGRTFGVLGFGQIARAVAARAAGFGYRVVAHDPALADEAIRAGGAEPRSFEELLREADVLSVHVPLTDSTRGLVGRAELALLPEGAVVVNTARGGIVDEDALVDALRAGRLRGAALDVLTTEPLPPDHPLRRVPGLLLTPHAAWYSEEAIPELRRKAFEAAVDLARGGTPAGLVTA
jgi:D-3-phosphoglycerate dehydrogenase / 2-oxoglutarate reductase